VPTYAYACTECGHRFEAVQSFTDDALTVCPQCEGRLRKVFSNVGIVFKGSGFYRNDSRSETKVNGSSKPAEKTAEKAADKSSANGSSEKNSDSSSSKAGSATSGAAKAGTGSGSAA
jgi:putative FmdB family regulatory protein